MAAPDWLPLQHVYPRVNDWGVGPLAEIERVLDTVRIVWYGVVLAAGLAFLIWLTGAVKNLRVLGVARLRVHPAWAVVSLLALLPALFAIHTVFDDQTEQKVVPAIVIAGLATPLIVIRWLWTASRSIAPDPSSADRPAASWEGILVWWVAFTVFWISSRLALTMFEEADADAFSPVETAVRVMAIGSFEFVAGVAWATAAVFIVRIIFRETAMQDAAARELPKPPSDPVGSRAAPPGVEEDAPTVASDAVTDIPPPARRRATQWQCESCEVMNPTALRFCQNCASERR